MYKVSVGKKLTNFQKTKNHLISKIRGMVEGVFGTLKRVYGFVRSCYLGILKTNGQLLLSSIAFNLKKASDLQTKMFFLNFKSIKFKDVSDIVFTKAT